MTGRDGRQLAQLGAFDTKGGQLVLGAQAATDDDAAFVVQSGTGDNAQDTWSLYLFTRTDKTLRKIASNPVDSAGRPLRGGYVVPFFDTGHLYWIQAASINGRYRGSELEQYNLRLQRTRTLFTGLVTAAVPYRNDVLLSAAAAGDVSAAAKGPQTSLHVLSATTGLPQPPLPGLDLGADTPYQMVSNGDLVVWDSGFGGLREWAAATRRTETLLPNNLNAPAAIASLVTTQNLGMYGPFLTWDSPAAYVMDVRTSVIAALTTNHGEVALSRGRVAFWQYASPNPPVNPAGPYTYSAYLMSLSSLPELSRC